MIRQYVGARYVPKFASPTEWKSGTSYEALTIVTYNNASYTSKVPVPPTVGNPADNPDYWALTGNYNAQVEEYRQTVELYKGEIDELSALSKEARALIKPKNYKILFCGDSYDVSNAKTLATRLADKLGCSVTDISVSGRGIGAGLRYANLLSEFTSGKTADELSQFTHIIIEGGANDFGVSSNDIISGANAIKIETDKFKNAKVYLAYVGSSIPSLVTDPVWTSRATYANMRGTYGFWNNVSILIGAKFMSTAINWADNTHFQSDYIHPNDSGMNCITDAIIMELLNSSYIGYYENSSIKGGTLSSVTAAGITRSAFSNTLHLVIDGDVSFTTTGANEVDIGTLETPIIPGRECSTYCTSTIKLSNGKIIAGLTRIYLTNDNKLKLQLLNINSDGTNYENYDITYIGGINIFMTIPLY